MLVWFQMGQSRWWEQEIPIEGNIRVGELLTYNLTELIKPESYLVRLTPITRFGEGDATERIITYSRTYDIVLFINLKGQFTEITTNP